MPGLTLDTGSQPASSSSSAVPSRGGGGGTTARQRHTSASSPSRPPVSPITPTFAPAQAPPAGAATAAAATTSTANIPPFSLDRPTFTHTTQTDQIGVPPPRAEPIDFESNPDVLALKSAISILQLQRNRAAADIQALSRARDAALARPEEFAADLLAGRVRMEGDPLLAPSAATGYSGSGGGGEEAEGDSDSSSESDSEPDPSSSTGDGQGKPQPQETTPDSEPTQQQPPNGKSKRKSKPSTNQQQPTEPPPPWRTLPKPQTIVRCPPINWAQYGVVGESFDKLHAEQLAAPTPGVPAVLGPGGTFEFRAGVPGGVVPPSSGSTSLTGAGAGAGGNPLAASIPAGGVVGQGGAGAGQRGGEVAAAYSPFRDKVGGEGGRRGRGGKR
ncbi:hypothetical protein VTJ04DRAFT_2924 [Mycothermus thermophilus]|uniref:uncharacterized protein n=1 Tax=Humicola insolens TaxID=85995 RepID=UPI00374496A9